MKVVCVRDCHDGKGLFIHGQEYEIDLKNPADLKNSCIIHVQAGAGWTPEEIKILAQAQRAEVARGGEEMENKRAAAPEENSEEDFTSFKLADGK
jgi:hypothetical protein